ncbi:ATP-binding cassette domain-containing protein [Pseudoduganella eburnea]|uniref:ATP-binding cassette domain-containing protein n=1 Tax=Massilia eburnea TaxID=1776165 RepID=A0A6L6QQE2_9BURK|nr:ATP-binding cassette domain-containing protein [Massilia eburnea]
MAIRVQNLSKCFQVYAQPHDRLKQSILPRLQRAVGASPKKYHRDFWALKDISFDVKKGETVGIIGRNGSGKSTLLQLICGTLNPTGGSMETHGRIAALLELGSGFNPEFTGRENVYLNAAVLGLSRQETDARFADIAAFADIGDFIEQPVKTYSSGMMVRLAFAVAINVDPEILIVDEALSVGDELFQRKCFSRIEAIRANGATILFVSHSGSQIVELCDRAVLLDSGEKIAEGMPKQIVGQYQKLLYAPADKRSALREQIRLGGLRSNVGEADGSTSVAPEDVAQEDTRLSESYDPSLVPSSTIEYESHGAYIENAHIVDQRGRQVNSLIAGKRYRYRYEVRFDRSANNVRFGMLIKTVSGLELGGAQSAIALKDCLATVAAGTVYRVEFAFVAALNTGTYFLNAGVMGSTHGDDGYLHRLIDVAMFRVMPDSSRLLTGIMDFSCVPGIEEVVVNEA